MFTFLALLALVMIQPVSAQSSTDYKEPDYTKFKVENGQITLEVWSWLVGLDQVVKEFEQAFPNIKVHVNNVGGGPAEYQKLQTVLKAGSGAPDVVQIEYDFLPSFITTDGLADISQYGANDAKSYFVDWTWGQVAPDGKAVYGIPQDTGRMAFVYNKKIFDQYQLTVPTTWEEFAQQAEKLAKASDGKVKMANFFPTHAPWFIGLAWASGGEFFKEKGDVLDTNAEQFRLGKGSNFLGWLNQKRIRFNVAGFYSGILFRTRIRTDRLIAGSRLGSWRVCRFIEGEDIRRMAGSPSSSMEQGSTVPRRKLGR